MEWLIDQAYNGQANSMVDTISFSASAIARQVVLYIHYYSPEQKDYYMSYVNSYMTTDPKHIQECHNVVKNILDYGLGMRQKKVQECLEPISQGRHQMEEESTCYHLGELSTLATSFTTVTSSGRKLQR